MPELIAKIIGADFELANSLHTPGDPRGRVDDAAERLLNQIPGIPRQTYNTGTQIEFGRRFLSGSGGSAYIDSGHLEVNTPEHFDSRQHALYIHGGLRLARSAQVAAAADLPSGTRLKVRADNCDGHVSYGSHFNILTSRRCFENILYRRPHLAGFLASHLVTSVLFSGQGMVGAANGRPACDYQLSQRADFFERFAGQDTMQNRPLLNRRDESHANAQLARLHLIFPDMTLAPIARRLLAGSVQLVVAMCEAGWADPTLQLDDPLETASRISRDLSLRERLPMAVRRQAWTAAEIQSALAERAGEFVETGLADDAVPGAREIVALWRQTAGLLRERAIEALAARTDNWLKYLLLDRQRARRGLSWQSPEMKALDLIYGSLDPAEGLFFQMARQGLVEAMPSELEIERAVAEPPVDTRAYLRAHILRRFGRHVYRLDWSWLDFRVASQRGWSSVARLPMNDPRRFNQDECEALLGDCESLEDLVEALLDSTDENAVRSSRASTTLRNDAWNAARDGHSHS